MGETQCGHSGCACDLYPLSRSSYVTYLHPMKFTLPRQQTDNKSVNKILACTGINECSEIWGQVYTRCAIKKYKIENILRYHKTREPTHPSLIHLFFHCRHVLRGKMSDISSNVTSKPLNPRDSAKFISSRSQNVSICQKGVEEASKGIFDCLKSKKYSFKSWKEHELHPNDMTKETLDWIVVLDALNFSFWTDEKVEPWIVRFEGKNYKGYWALCAAVNRALKVCIKWQGSNDDVDDIDSDSNNKNYSNKNNINSNNNNSYDNGYTSLLIAQHFQVPEKPVGGEGRGGMWLPCKSED